MTYSSRHLSALFDITTETVRAWSEEFGTYLSTNANPGRGRHRSFTEGDLEVFALIAEYKNRGLTFQDVHIALQNGQRGEAPDMSPDEVQSLIVSEQEKRLSFEIQVLQTELQKRQSQIETLLAEVETIKPIREENIQLKADLRYAQQREEELEERLSAAEQRIHALLTDQKDLQREIGRAQGILEVLKMKGDLPGSD